MTDLTCRKLWDDNYRYDGTNESVTGTFTDIFASVLPHDAQLQELVHDELPAGRKVS